VEDAFNKGVFIEYSNRETKKDYGKLVSELNAIYYHKHHKYGFFDYGEIDVLAVAHEINSKIVLIDELATRSIIEDPGALEQRHNKMKLRMDEKHFKKVLSFLESLMVVRSCDLFAFYALDRKMETKLLKAALYHIKYVGCSISTKEIEDFVEWVENENK
jgi:hypothetical protein